MWCFSRSLYSNVAEALVSKGLATVIRYRQDDDQRSSHYDELLAAESRAIKKGVGVHSKKEPPIHRVADVSGVSFLDLANDKHKVKKFIKKETFVNVRKVCEQN